MLDDALPPLLAAIHPDKAAAVRLLVYTTFGGLLVLVVLTTAYLLLRGRRHARALNRRNPKADAQPSAWEIAGRRSAPLAPSSSSSATSDTVDIDPDDPGSVDIGPDDVTPGGPDDKP